MITFKFHLSYMNQIHYKVMIDGIEDNHILIYSKDAEYLKNLESAKKMHYNVHSEIDFQLNLKLWVNTIHYEYSSDVIPNDVYEAFKIACNDDTIKRAIFKCEFINTDKPIAEWIQVNSRVEYY